MDDSDSDDDYWGSYERIPQETVRVPRTGVNSAPWKSELSACSTTSTGSSQETELESGALVAVGAQSFELHELIGAGSFGSVWRASCRSSGASVALKEVVTGKMSIEAVHLEAQHLHALRGLEEGEGVGPAGCALPHLRAAGTAAFGENFRVIMVMEQVPGEPLQQALEAGKLLAPKADPVAHAFRVVGDMLGQLALKMLPMSARLLHRDANSQNILIQASACSYKFGLIDFGLAVDSVAWAGGGWRGAGAGGDGRYWTCASWLFFAQGAEAMDQELQAEYAERVDLHSTGLSALQALVMLALEANQRDEVTQSMQQLQEAWKEYWCYASSRWEQVLDAFNRDARGAIKEQLAEEGAHRTFLDHFAKLRAKLEQVQAALEDTKDFAGFHSGAMSVASGVIKALLLMISAGRPPSGGWEQVLQLLNIRVQTDTAYIRQPGLDTQVADKALRVDPPGKWER